MDRDRLYRLYPKDKGKAPLERAKCVGFISENGNFECRFAFQNKPMNAVLYLNVRPSRHTYGFLECDKQRGMEYCRVQGYEPLVLLESIGGDFLGEGKALERILELAEQRLVDIVVLSHVNNLFQFLDHASGILENLYNYDVMVDCVGCGILDRRVFEAYQRKSWIQERAFRVKLMGLILNRKKAESEGDHLC